MANLQAKQQILQTKPLNMKVHMRNRWDSMKIILFSMQILSHSNICRKIGVSKLTYNDLFLWFQGRQQFNAKIEKIAVSPQMQHDNDDPHMKGTPKLSLQIFSLFQKMMINTQLK